MKVLTGPTTYFKHFPFKEDEKLLFLSYLAQPGPMYRLIEKYFSSGKEKNEMKFVRQLQRQYWKMKNAEYVVMKLDEIERRKKEMSQTPLFQLNVGGGYLIHSKWNARAVATTLLIIIHQLSLEIKTYESLEK